MSRSLSQFHGIFQKMIQKYSVSASWESPSQGILDPSLIDQWSTILISLPIFLRVHVCVSKRLGCKAVRQEVSRCCTTGECTACSEEARKRWIHPDFEIQRRSHKKSKTGALVPRQQGLMFSKNTFWNLKSLLYRWSLIRSCFNVYNEKRKLLMYITGPFCIWDCCCFEPKFYVSYTCFCHCFFLLNTAIPHQGQAKVKVIWWRRLFM